MIEPESPTPERSSVFSGVRWNIAGQGIQHSVRLATTLILARLLTPEDFGLVSMAQVVIMFVNLFVDMGTGQALIQRKELTPGLLNSTFLLNLIIGAVLAAAIYFGAPLLARGFAEPRLLPILEVLSINFVILSFAVVQRSLITRRMRFDQLASLDAVGAIVQAGVSIVLAFQGHGVWSIIVGILAKNLVITGAAWVMAHWRPGVSLVWEDLRSIAGFSLNLAGFNLVNYLVLHADKIIIGRFLGSETLGYYEIARRLTTQPVRAVSVALGNVLFVRFSQLQDQNEKLRRRVIRASGAITLICAPLMFGLALVAESFVPVILGDSWLGVTPLLQILAPVSAIVAINRAASLLYRAKARTDWLLWFGIVRGVVMIGAYFIGLRWGLLGVAYAIASVQLLFWTPALIIPFSLIELRLSEFARSLWPYALASAVMAVAVVGVEPLLGETTLPWIQLASSVGLGAIAYLGTVAILRPPVLQDLLQLAGLSRG